MNTTGPSGGLQGRRIFVVEDEMMLSMMIEDMLTEFGCEVVQASRISEALELAATTAMDAALLDVNVAGAPIDPVARELQKRGIPFVFSTGYGAGGVPADYRGWLTLSKPFQQEELQTMLERAIAAGPAR